MDLLLFSLYAIYFILLLFNEYVDCWCHQWLTFFMFWLSFVAIRFGGVVNHCFMITSYVYFDIVFMLCKLYLRYIILYSSVAWCSCETCGLSKDHCSGHFGHIELVSPVYNPLMFLFLGKILNRTCFSCHRFRASRNEVNIFWFLLHCFCAFHKIYCSRGLMMIQGGKACVPIGAHFEREY